MRSLRGVYAPLIKFLIFAVVTVLATMLLAGTIANKIGGDTVTYSARFSDVAGLVNGDEVRIAGVRVGEVDDIKLVDRKVAQVDISLRRDLVLPGSTQATIKFRNLIGQRYIALDQGVGPPGNPLKPGDTLQLDHTHPAVSLTALFQGFQPLFQALSPQDVNQLSYELVQVLQGEGGTVSSLLSHTASLTSTIADKDQVIGEVIDNLNQVLDTINARDAQFTQLVITVRQLISGLAQDRDTIGHAIASIGELTDTTAGLVADARPPLRQDIRSLGDLAGNLNDNRPLVEGFITKLPHKLDALTPLGTYSSWFNFYLCGLGGTLTAPVIGTQHLPVYQSSAYRCTAQSGTATGNPATVQTNGHSDTNGDPSAHSGTPSGPAPTTPPAVPPGVLPGKPAGNVPGLPLLGGNR